MLYAVYEYSGKKFIINPYNSGQEKDLLLLTAVDNPDLDIALKICGIQDSIIDSLTDDEKVAFLYKLREISVGEELDLKFKCKHCETPNDNKLNISNIIKSRKRNLINIIDKFKVLSNENIQDFTTIDINELDLDQYDNLFADIKNSVTNFEFVKPITCQKCRKDNYIRIDKPDFILDNLSEDTLTSIYQTYNDLIFHGNYTKSDIDNMYPFERTIFFSLLEKSRENLNE